MAAQGAQEAFLEEPARQGDGLQLEAMGSLRALPRCVPDTNEISQVPTKGRHHVHMGSTTARGSSSAKPFARGGCCFPANRTASAPRNSTRFPAQYPSPRHPL